MWASAISADGTLAAGGSDDFVVRIWEVDTRKLRIALYGHTQSIRVLGWSPDGRIFASGGRDTTVRLWDATTWTLQQTLPHGNTVRGMAWAPDGARLFTGTADECPLPHRVSISRSVTIMSLPVRQSTTRTFGGIGE